MNDDEVLAMMKRHETQLLRMTEIAEAQEARMRRTLEEVRALRVHMFGLQTLAHEMRRAAGIANT